MRVSFVATRRVRAARAPAGAGHSAPAPGPLADAFAPREATPTQPPIEPRSPPRVKALVGDEHRRAGALLQRWGDLAARTRLAVYPTPLPHERTRPTATPTRPILTRAPDASPAHPT